MAAVHVMKEWQTEILTALLKRGFPSACDKQQIENKERLSMLLASIPQYAYPLFVRERSIFPTAKVLNVPQIRQSWSKPYIKMGQFKTFCYNLEFHANSNHTVT